MPAYVIVSTNRSSIDAVMCDLGGAGGPDRKSAVPVRIEFTSERVLAVDGQPHEIISTMGGDGTATYLIDFNAQRLRNRTQRMALAQAAAQLERLRAQLLPIKAGSEHPQPATEGLKLLTTWFAEEAERLSGVRSLDR